MAKYINVDECRRRFINFIYSICAGDTGDRASEIKNEFDNLPPADVQEVKRGHIVEKKRHRNRWFSVKCHTDNAVRRQGFCKGDCYTHEDYEYYEHYCSECGKVLGICENYCGNCGADLRGGNNV